MSTQRWNLHLLLMAFLCYPLMATASTGQFQDESEKPELRITSRNSLPSKAILQLGTKQVKHASLIAQTAVSADGKRCFTIDSNSLIAWDLESGKPLWKKKLTYSHQANTSPSQLGVRPFAMMPDSGRVVTSSRNGRLKFWDPDTGKSKTIKCPVSTTWKSIDVSPDSLLFAVGDANGLWVCNPEGEAVYRLKNDRQSSTAGENGGTTFFDPYFGYSYGRFSPNGKLLAVVKSDAPRTILILDAPSGDEIFEIKTTGKVARMDFAPDSSTLAASESDHATRLYDVQTGKCEWEHAHEAKDDQPFRYYDIDFRPDGKQVAVCEVIGSDEQIQLLDASTGNPISRITQLESVFPAKFHPNSQKIVVECSNSRVRSRAVETGQPIPVDDGVHASGYCAISGDGKNLAFVDKQSNIHLVDISTGEVLQSFKESGANSVGPITFNDSGTQLAAGFNHDGKTCLAVWDIAKSTQVHRWSWDLDGSDHSTMNEVCFSRDGKRIAASMSHQDFAYVLDLSSDKQLSKLPHENISGLSLNADGSVLYSVGADGSLRVWDCNTETELAQKQVTQEQGLAVKLNGVILSHNQKIIATSDKGSRIRLFDTKLNSLGIIDGLGDLAYGTIDFSHNDLWISAGTDIGLFIFDIATGERVFFVNAHEQNIVDTHFGVDAKTILSGGEDGVCYLWNPIPKTSIPKDIEEHYNQVTSVGGAEAYSAFYRLTQAPEQTFKYMNENLMAMATQQVSEREIAKWIAALGSTNSRRISLAKKKLWELGPTAYPQLIEALKSDGLSSKKHALIQELAVSIHCRYRRAVMLFAELDLAEVDKSLSEMLKNSASSHWTSLLEDAQEIRERIR